MANFFMGMLYVLIGIVILIILGIIIHYLRTRTHTTTTAATPTAPMISPATLYNALWMIGSYLVVLWAIAVIWPDEWKAWRSSTGFWISQLLFISMIGFFALDSIRAKKLSYLGIIPGLLALIMIMLTIFKHHSKNDSNDQTTQVTELRSPPKTDTWIEVFVKSTGSHRLENYDGYSIQTLTNFGASEPPIPYRRKDGITGNEDWVTYGVGNEDLNITKMKYVWLSGVSSDTSTRIWYRYKSESLQVVIP